MDLVKGRDCGECSVCCTTPPIYTKEFQKPPDVRCKHLCAGGGCSIYDTRYSVCRDYHCGWRYFGFLGDDWRPDKSGILLNIVREDEVGKMLPQYEAALILFLAAQPPSNLSPLVSEFVARLISAGVLVVLAVNGPPGHDPAYAYLNETLKEAGMEHDVNQVAAALSEALAMHHRFEALRLGAANASAIPDK